MAVFIDTGVFVGFLNESDQCHGPSRDIMEGISEGRFGKAYTSDYVLDEVVTFTCRKTKNPNVLLEATDLLQNSEHIYLLHVGRSTFSSAKMCVEQYPHLMLSFTDWTTANLMAEEDIRVLASFDSGFERVTEIRKFSGIRRLE